MPGLCRVRDTASVKVTGMKTRTIRQYVTLAANPHDVYESLMDSKKHSRFTGCPAQISREVGGRFSAMESLRGKNIALVPDQKIVQAWQCDYEGWPKDHFSKVTIRLKQAGRGTQLAFSQSKVPAVCFTGIRDAWRKYYWRPLKRMLASANHSRTAPLRPAAAART